MTTPDRSLDRSPFFVVGCPRSGTTLLRLMLNAHPRLAVPPETHWIVALGPRRPPQRVVRLLPEPRPLVRLRRTDDLEAILAYRTFPRLELDPDEIRERARAVAPRGYPELVRLVMGMYAERKGKPRWGDKTPRYVDHMALLARWLPDARFIHVIRDGRDVAASLRESSGTPIASAALFWRRRVERGLRAGARLGPSRYIQTRLEDLLAGPEAELTRICHHLREEFDPSMLDGGLELDPGELAYRERHLRSPPTPGLRDWRSGLSPREQRQAQEVCRPLLRRLGYEIGGTPSKGVAAGARVTRALDVVSRAPAFARGRGKRLEEVAGRPGPRR